MTKTKRKVKYQRIPKEIINKMYWEDLLSPIEIAIQWEKLGNRWDGSKDRISRSKWVISILKEYCIPMRNASERASLWQLKKRGIISPFDYQTKTMNKNDQKRLHRIVWEDYYGGKLKTGDVIHHKDGNKGNNHPLNLDRITHAEHNRIHREGLDSRPSLYETYMRMTETLSRRSIDPSFKNGAIITNFELTKIIAFGYNGSASGLLNEVESEERGKSGTIHAEENALLKSSNDEPMIMFSTSSPCVECAKKIINSNISDFYFRNEYRDKTGLGMLKFSGIRICKL